MSVKTFITERLSLANFACASLTSHAGIRKGSVVGTLLPVLVVPILLLVMIVVYANFDSSIDTTGLSTNATDAITKVNTQSYNAFNLASILPIVLIGVAVIGVILGAFAMRGRD